VSNALKPIVILGAGGHAQEVAWIIDDLNQRSAEWDLLGFVDTGNSGKKQHYGRPVLGGYEDVAERFGQPFFACGMGAPSIRAKEAGYAEQLGWQPAALVHPLAVRAKFVGVGPGTTVAAGCALGPCAQVGRHCLINTHASIGHDSCVGDFCVISPGARVLGNVILENEVFVGANASIYPGRHVGAGATLAANSFLQADLAPGLSALGVFAKAFHRS
jgi:sugar O-acyltransferase (sialic acid O-acetyltransferase NeuD family)